MKTIEINVRAVYSFRSIRVGHTALTWLCGFLKMPPPMNKNAFDSLSYFVKFRSKQAAEKGMSNATVRLRGTEQTTYVDIFVDGT